MIHPIAPALAGLLCLSAPASADMIDYAFAFTSQAQAIADATMLAGHYNATINSDTDLPVGWAQDHVIAGLQCWRPSQDTQVANPSPPPATLTQHTYLTGYYVVVSIDTPSPIAALLNHSALKFALDRTKREAGQAFVVKNNIGAVITDIACAPLFASTNPYPMGGFN